METKSQASQMGAFQKLVWTTKDGTPYFGINGHTMIKCEGVSTPEQATGHLQEAVSAGAQIVFLNLRPGIHHIKF